MTILAEKYRPATWSEVVGQDKALRQLEQLRPRGLAGRAYWVSGQSGTGKTTIGRLIAREIADPMNIVEVDASELTAEWLRNVERSCSLYGMGAKSGRAYIVNEAHGLNKAAIRRLLVMLEEIPQHCLWVFTTTVDGQEALFEDQIDAGPLLSRCIPLTLSRRDLARPFAERCKNILEREGLDGAPIERYIAAVKEERNNMRALLQRGERGDFRFPCDTRGAG